jgi:hypothetical protein
LKLLLALCSFALVFATSEARACGGGAPPELILLGAAIVAVPIAADLTFVIKDGVSEATQLGNSRPYAITEMAVTAPLAIGGTLLALNTGTPEFGWFAAGNALLALHGLYYTINPTPEPAAGVDWRSGNGNLPFEKVRMTDFQPLLLPDRRGGAVVGFGYACRL